MKPLGSFCKKCVASVFSACRGLDRGLKKWVDEKIGQAEHASRIIAADKIKDCYAFKNRELDLRELGLTSLPVEIGNLIALQKLYLTGNRLTSLPAEIGNLIALKELNLWRNRLISLPAEIGKLIALQKLFLSENRLISLPVEIGNLIALQELDLSENRLISLPVEIGNLIALQELDLWKNQLISLPVEICNLIALQVLGLVNNRLISLPAEIGNLIALRILSLANNQQLNELPLSITSLGRGCNIYLENCALSNTVLERIRTLVNAENYQGPRFSYSIQERDAGLVDTPLNELLDQLYASCGKEKPDLSALQAADAGEGLHPRLLQGANAAGSLQPWLGRLSWVADFKKGGEQKINLSRKVTEYLELANKDVAFRGLFLAIINGAATTCGDRVALSVIDLGIAKRLAEIDSNGKICLNIKDLEKLLISGSWTIDLLKVIAGEKVAIQRFVDEIEVYLGYLVPQTSTFTEDQKKIIASLLEQLNLPLDVEEMLYFACSNLSFTDLRDAYTSILKQRNSPEKTVKFLANDPYWRKALQQIAPQKYEEALSSDDPPQALGELTKKIRGAEVDEYKIGST